jgi:hypothetical protein
VTLVIEAPEACIACGCTEFEPCPGGCAWAVINPDTGARLCTRCAKLPLVQLATMAANAFGPRNIALARIAP